MINIYTRVTFALVSFIFISPGAHAQFAKEAVIQLLDDALRTHLVNVLPHHHCPCNNCQHTYTGDVKISKTGRAAITFQPVRREERITVWGNASVIQSSTFLGSSTVINFYAELREVNGAPDLVKLKWKQNDCMQYVMLFNKDEDEFMPDATQAEILASQNRLKEKLARDAEEFPLLFQDPVSDALVEGHDSVKNIIDGALSALNPQDAATARIGARAPAAPEAPAANDGVGIMPETAPDEATETRTGEGQDDGILVATTAHIAIEYATARYGNAQQPPLDTLPVKDMMVAKSVSIAQDDRTRDPATYLTIEFELQEKAAKKGKKKDEQNSDDSATHILVGHILSRASETRIKDAVLELAFYTKTDTKIASETRPLYEFFDPGQPTSFSFEVTPPPFTDYAGMTILKVVWVEK